MVPRNGIMATMQNNSWREALQRTRRAAFGQIATLFGQSELDNDFWDDLETTLIQADIGVSTTALILDELKNSATTAGIIQAADLRTILEETLLKRIALEVEVVPQESPFVTMLIGVNGSGKTTAAARLGYMYQQQGCQVLLAAADTYRAAAVEQLEAWGSRLNIDVVSGKQGSDPGAVVFSAAQAAQARAVNHLIVDTSGRMHTSHNLMAELQKLVRVAGKVIPGAPHATYLVLDAITGQNGLAQARSFAGEIKVDGVILSKLDSSARGGIVLSIASELKLPILFVGLGEGLHDLVRFDPQAYVRNLLSDHGT